MPFIKSNQKDYLLKLRINIGHEMAMVKAEDVYIILKEPPERDKIMLQEAYKEKDSHKLMDALYPILAGLIVEHNFYEDELTPMTEKGLIEFLKDKSFALEKVITEFAEWIQNPFAKKKEGK